MYLEYFGLSQAPFKITPDTKLFYSGGNRGAILEALIYAITNGEGIVKVVGEVGTGKTMLCRMLEVELADNIEVVYLANPSLSPDHIPYAIAFELKLEIAASSNRLQVMNELQNYLLDKHRRNGQVVVFVEEAQSMPLASLEELRLLSNLETGQSKLLQIVLFGQPELDEMIGSTEIRQLKERITYSFQLTPFKTPDIKEYLSARVRACGYRAGELFTPGSIREITRYSNGLLRRVNILADKALLSAYATGNKQVKSSHVKVAARDSEFISRWHRLRWPLTAAAAVLLLAAGLFYVLDRADLPGMIDRLASITTATPGQAPVTSPPPPEKVTATPPAAEVVTAVSPAQPAAPEREQDAPVAPADLNLTLQPDAGLSIAAMTPEPGPGLDETGLTGAITIEQQELRTEPVPALDPVDKPHIAPSPALPQPVAAFQAAVPSARRTGTDKLLALENIIKQQDLGVVDYTEKELSMMLEQLEKIPSESIINDSDEEATCETCASLIYRPLYKKENL